MDTKIIDYAKELLGGNFIQTAAQKLGESPDGISKAISAIIPSIFSGISSKISSDSSFLTTVVSEAKNIFTNHSLSDIGSLINSDTKSPETTQSSSFLFDVFGGGLHNIIEKISSFAGIKTSSTRQLFDASGIASLGSLGKSFVENNATLDSVGSFFKNHASSFLSSIPASLGLGSLLSGLHTHAPKPDTSHAYAVPPAKKGGSRFLVPLILALIALFLLIWLFRSCKGNEAAHDGTDTTAVTQDTSSAVVPVRTLTAVILPNGDTLQAYPGGIEDQLVKFIESDEYKNATDSTLKNKWFNFDDLNFKFGTTELDTTSTRQLNNIVAILKAFPTVKIKIGGYTDKKGDSTANLKLSDGRAKTVQSALKTAGVGAQVPEADGYGSKFATVDASASDEARAVDRHTSVRLIK
ncbi:MAG: OmpA family protein [Arachidicoccus sp.]|nr:OmpA family protein [Arachidicoccus sp.]